MTRALLLAVLLLAPLASLAPGARADDAAYGHRYTFEGRLVGADGLPLPGRAVALNVSTDALAEPCSSGHQDVTDAWGDFRFCFHAHEVRAGTRITAEAANTSVTKLIDATFRRTFVLLQGDENGTAPDGWETTHRVSIRAWRPGPVDVDGVVFAGLATPNKTAVLTVLRPDGTNETLTSTTDEHGDAEFHVQIENDTGTSLVLAIDGQQQSPRLDPTFHRSYMPFIVPTGYDRPPGNVPTSSDGSRAPPGSATPAVDVRLVLVAALALAGTIWFARKKD